MAMGEDLPLLSILSRKTRGGVPAAAILVQALIATAMLWTDTFETLVKFVQFSLTFCSFLAVLGVIVLRYTRPELPRPYRVWAYPLTPLLFLAMSLFMMGYLLREQPREALIGVGIMLTSLLIYGVASIVSPSPQAKSSETAMDPLGR